MDRTTHTTQEVLIGSVVALLKQEIQEVIQIN